MANSKVQVAEMPSHQQQNEKLQHELEMVTKQLEQIARLRKSNEEAELEHQLLDRRIVIQLKLKRWKVVIEEGYKILGKKGPSIIIYKCILVGLCRLGRYGEEVSDLLDVWRKASPKCPQMNDCNQKMTYYLNAIKSGLDPIELFKYLEETLGLNTITWMLNTESHLEDGDNVKAATATAPKEIFHWKFRPPPPNDVPFYLCPRGGNSCMYGNTCSAAHSAEELDEWINRKGLTFNNNSKFAEEKVNLQIVSENKSKSESDSTKLENLSGYRILLKGLPSFAYHYLVEIHKRIKETHDKRDIFSEDIPNVKFVCKTPLHIIKKIPVANLGTSTVATTWTFVVSTKAPMRNVCLLENIHRECFRITSGKFLDKSKTSLNLVELHDNNALQDTSGGIQVLNSFIPLPLLYQMTGGWPEWFFYKIEVTFSQPPLQYGQFLQSVMFDMKSDPKLIKHLTVEIYPDTNQSFKNEVSHASKQPFYNGFYTNFNGPNIVEKDKVQFANHPLDNTIGNKIKSPTNSENTLLRSSPVLEQNSGAPQLITVGTVQPKKYHESNNNPLFSLKSPNGFSQPVTGMNRHKIAPKQNYQNLHDIQQAQNPFDNICENLNPSKLISEQTSSKHSNGQKVSMDIMPSLYQQDFTPTASTNRNDAFKGSNLSLRSNSSSSVCTLSSSDSFSGELNASNNWNSTDYPGLPKSSVQKNEWIKVNKSKKSKFTIEREEILENDKPKSHELTTDMKIGFLEEMGFDKRSAIKALQYCERNLERSVEWLVSGEGRHK